MSRGLGPIFPIVQGAHDLSHGGFALPYTPDGLYHFEPPLTFAPCEAVTLGDAENCRSTDPTKIVMKSHATWGFASARQWRRALADSAGGNMHSVTCVDYVPAQREVCRAFDKASHVPVAGTSTLAMFTEKLHVDPLFSADTAALRIIAFFPNTPC